jgi:hypothetical protein
MGQWWSKGHSSSIDVRGANNNVVLIHGSVRVHDDWTAAVRRLEQVILREHQRWRWTIVAIVVLLLVILLVDVVFRCWRRSRQRPAGRPIELNSVSRPWTVPLQ